MADGTFETDRLRVRNWRESDLPHLIELRTNPHVMAHFPGTDSIEKIEAYFPQMCQRSTDRGYGFRPVFEKSNGEFIGFCGITDVNFETHFTPAMEIGWSLLPRFWGKGYATEAAGAWLSLAFDKLGKSEIVAFAVIENTRSHAVMRRLGMQRDPAKDFIHPRSWTQKKNQNGVKTAKICKEKTAGWAGGPFKGFDAADCSGFIVQRI